MPEGVYEATFPSMTTINGDVACDTITIIDDNVLEGPHDFGFLISGTLFFVRSLLFPGRLAR